MKYADDVSKAIDLLKRTLPEMSKRNIPSTPQNYAIWYEFVAGENPKLQAAIKELDQAKTIFNSQLLNSLYNEFISNAHEAAVNQLSESVREIIHDFLLKMDKEGKDLGQYAQTLSQVSAQVAHIRDVADIKDLLQILLTETKKREEATHCMQSMIENMSFEMKKLRSEVAKLHSEASTDPLTRINTRRAFDIEVEGLVALSNAENIPLCLVLIDIDNFSAFNEKFGQTIGDKVLRFVASLVKSNIKGNDSASRFGSAQFAVLLPETKLDGAISVAENIRQKLAKQTLSDSVEKIELGTITASFGVNCHQPGESVDDLINHALRALIDAKKAGRNQVIGSRRSPITTQSCHRIIL